MSALYYKHKVYVKSSTIDNDEADDWCEEHFGIRGDKWDCWFADDSPYNYDEIYVFVNQADAVLFTLRWV